MKKSLEKFIRRNFDEKKALEIIRRYEKEMNFMMKQNF